MAARATYKELEQKVKDLAEEVRALKSPRGRENNRYGELADLLPQTVFEVDKKGNIIFANQHGFEASGYTEGDLRKGMNALQLFIPEDRKRAKKNIREILGGQKSRGNEYTILRKDGTTFSAIVYSGIIIQEGKPAGLRGIVVDITQLKRTQEALAQSEKRVGALLNAAKESVFLVDPEGTILAVNETAAHRLGKKREELLGVNLHGLISPKDAKRRKAWVSKVIRSRKAACFEDERDGKIWSHSIYPIRNERGKIEQVAIYSANVTAEKQAIARMKENETALKAKKIELQEVNAALRVLLKGRDRDRAEFEEKVLSNVNELIEPYIDKLKKSRLDTRQMTYLKILESNLNNIVSPFVRHLSSKYSALTPTEIQVAQLIREGRTTKEIADLFNSSKRTIESHRQSIRIKLGIKDTKANLRSHLSSM